MEKGLIVKNYLFGWFFIDFMATVQWDKVRPPTPATGHHTCYTHLNLQRGSHMLKLLTATTGGGDDIIVIDIYDLLRRAHTHCRSSYLPHPPQFATNERAPVHFCRPQLPSPAC